MQIVFFLVAIFSLCMLIPFTQGGLAHIEKAKKQMPEGYEWPEISDLKVTAVSGVIFTILEYGLKELFTPMYSGICKEQTNLKLKEIKMQKMGHNTYKGIYFIGASVWGYMVLKDVWCMPWFLGGSGDFDKGMDGFPFVSPRAPGLKEYLQVTMGFHVSGCVTHFLVLKRQNDFVEMGLHHITAMYLFGGIYLLNAWEPGAVVAFLHDLADVTTSVIKVFSDTRFQDFAGFYFVTQ